VNDVPEYELPGIRVREHTVPVPLDWAAPDAGCISVFVRELAATTGDSGRLPYLVFLQGGPGGRGPRPVGAEGWLEPALERFRVLLVDQRGTGRSTPVTASRITAIDDPDAAARYLLHFRADSIVADLEHLRTEYFRTGPWTTLGQSYGGFITLRYLSAAPEGLSRCLVAGGLASVHPDAGEVYRRTYPRVAAKNERFYERYPGDRELVGAIADRIQAGEQRLPDGDRLSVRRLQTLGIGLGMGHGAEELHWLLEDALEGERLSDAFLDRVMTETGYWGNPLFMVLQESIYGSGPGATAWAAENERASHPEFDPERRPLLFTGEMMYPWMLEEIASLKPFRVAAEALAAVPEYTELYDRGRLAANEVPVDAVVYFDDMFVDAGLSLETAGEVGNVRTWVTNEFEHDGLRSGPRVFERLIGLRDA
jgi:proline iminopeptidase